MDPSTLYNILSHDSEQPLEREACEHGGKFSAPSLYRSMPEVGYIVQHRLHALLNHIRTLESKVSDLSTELDKERMQTQEVVKQQAICTIGREILERSFNRDLRMLRERVELEDNQREELMIAIQEIRAEFHRIFTESLTQPVPQVLPRPFEHAVPESNTTSAGTIVTPASVDFNTSLSSLYSPLKASQTTIDDADTNLSTGKSRATIVLRFIIQYSTTQTHVKMFRDTQLLDLQYGPSQIFSHNAVFVVQKTSVAIFPGESPDSLDLQTGDEIQILSSKPDCPDVEDLTQ